MDELIKYVRALVILQLQQMAGEGASQKPELLLSDAGFSHAEIAEMLKKKPGAIAKSISRARQAQQKESGNGDG